MKNTNIRSLCQIALMAAFIMACSFLVIPIPFSTVPVTAQTLAVALTGLLLAPKESGASVGVYILLAIVMGRFSIGPSTGYFVGFLISAVVISLIKGKKNNPLRYFLAALAAIAITDLCGMVGMMLALQCNLVTAFIEGCVVFLPGDLCKAVAAALLVAALRKALPKALSA